MALPLSGSFLQFLLALAYYATLVLLMRLAGKRLAGQTTTFDFVVLIALAVVLQQTMLRPGAMNAAIFVVTVFAAHRGLALWCARSRRVRRLLRGAPRPLIRDRSEERRVGKEGRCWGSA